MVRVAGAPDLAHAEAVPSRPRAALLLQQPGLELSDALHFDGAARLEHEAVAKCFPHRVGYLDLAGKPVQFEPRGEIHRLAPYVVGEFVGADHPGHHRAPGDADPDLEIDAVSGGKPLDEIGQSQRHAREPRQMVGLWLAHAGDRHVAVAGGLDLLHAVRRREPVELGDDLVEKRHGTRRAKPLGKLGEADEIAEQN